jgi:DNA-binding protein YbaB
VSKRLSVLKKAIEDYLDKLKSDETLQDRFIKAWSSVMDKADSNQLNEIKKLLDYLGLNSPAPIWRE